MHYGLTERQKSLLSAQIPREYTDTRDGLTYVTGGFINEYLDAVFGPGCWTFTIIEKWTQPAADFVDKRNRTQDGKLLTIKQSPLAVVHGRLTYPIYPQKDTPDEVLTVSEPKYFSQDAIGSKTFTGRSQNQENMFKIASTDALKKAASILGIARELYIPEANIQNPRYPQFQGWLTGVESSWTPYYLRKYGTETDKMNALQQNLAKFPEDTQRDIQQKIQQTMIQHNLPANEVMPENIVLYNETLLRLLQEKSDPDASHK